MRLRHVAMCVTLLTGQLSAGCAAGGPDLIAGGGFRVDPPASVTALRAFEDDGKLVVAGVIEVHGREKRYASGAVRGRLMSPGSDLLEEKTVCFASRKQARARLPARVWLSPRFTIAFDGIPPKGSELVLTPELDAPACGRAAGV